MRRHPFALGASLLGVMVTGVAIAMGGAAHNVSGGLDMGELGEAPVRRKRGKGLDNRRGKGAARRHGAKLRPNMRLVSKRVRHKHRKAARDR